MFKFRFDFVICSFLHRGFSGRIDWASPSIAVLRDCDESRGPPETTRGPRDPECSTKHPTRFLDSNSSPSLSRYFSASSHLSSIISWSRAYFILLHFNCVGLQIQLRLKFWFTWWIPRTIDSLQGICAQQSRRNFLHDVQQSKNVFVLSIDQRLNTFDIRHFRFRLRRRILDRWRQMSREGSANQIFHFSKYIQQSKETILLFRTAQECLMLVNQPINFNTRIVRDISITRNCWRRIGLLLRLVIC